MTLILPPIYGISQKDPTVLMSIRSIMVPSAQNLQVHHSSVATKHVVSDPHRHRSSSSAKVQTSCPIST